MPAVGHGEKGRLGTAIESSGDLGPPSPRRPDPERSLPALLPGSPSDSCSPLYRRGTGGVGGRGGASARKSRPHPLSAGPPGHSPLCHAPPLASPVFVVFFFSATALGAFPASQSLLFPAATRALIGFPELLNAGPQVPPSLPVPDLPSF